MSRSAALLLGALAAAAAVVGAPAPRPRPAVPWVTGWDEPVGDAQFVRAGGRLTITVQGDESRPDAPMLIRDAEGDFVVQVRVGGDFGAAGRRAGILLAGGKKLVRFLRAAVSFNGRQDVPCFFVLVQAGESGVAFGPPLGEPAYLRLERRGDLLRLCSSEDGMGWRRFEARPFLRPLPESLEVKLPRHVRAGVMAEAKTPGAFTATFDGFKLTPLGAGTR